MKKQNRHVEKNKRNAARPLGTGGIVILLLAVSLSALMVLFLILGPSVRARSVFSDALKAPKTSGGSVVIADPHVEGDLLPFAKEVSFDGDEGKELITRFLSAFESYRYVETSGIAGMKMFPYFCVKSGSTAYFYLEEDSVWVEKNSTFYRLRPHGEEREAIYAELYRDFMKYLADTDSE